MKEYDTEYQDEITCPYCGYKEEDSWDYAERDNEYTCGECDKECELDVIIQFSYCTEKRRIEDGKY